jgi:hypothetical protein
MIETRVDLSLHRVIVQTKIVQFRWKLDEPEEKDNPFDKRGINSSVDLSDGTGSGNRDLPESKTCN